MKGRIVLDGELYLTLETVAECYSVEVVWMYEVYELGLLGAGRRVGGTIAIAAVLLDRVAQIVRLHVQQGVNPAGIALLLEELEASRSPAQWDPRVSGR